MNQDLISEVSNWKLEAKLEDTNRYFFHTNIVDKLVAGQKAFVIGRKGTGKTAITEHLTKEKSYKRFARKLSFKHFPFGDLYQLSNKNFTSPNEYITLWKYLIYSSVAKMLVKNQNIDAQLRIELEKIYKGDIEQSLSRTIKRWVSATFKISIFGQDIEGSGENTTHDNHTPWIERVEILEDILLQNLDDSEYLIVFDELDEDYKDIIETEKHAQYTSLLTSLFKAVQDIRSIFTSPDFKLYPVVFLRDDIYDILRDPDKTKWNDFKVSLEWNESSIKDLLAFRISKAINSEGKTLEFHRAWDFLFIDKNVVYGTRQQKNMSAFQYITRSTQLRPRDYINYIQTCAEHTKDAGFGKISPNTIRKIDKAFSNYLRSEIEDEILGILPEIKKILNLFSRIRKQTLSIKEFEDAYNDAIKNEEMPERRIDFILQVLFHFSVIGNQPSQKNNHVFRYKSPEARFNQKEGIVVHRGLFKALQII